MKGLVVQSTCTTTICTHHQRGWSGPCPVDITIQAEADGLTFCHFVLLHVYKVSDTQLKDS